ncbi:MAG: cell division protein SepF [Clostridiales bacterium]|nr:cell division protein SepF [Clostridiales bacterium]
MGFSEFRNSLKRAFSRRDGDATRRPDGGTSCYRPVRKKTPEEMGYTQAEPQQSVPYVHTGFTGMNPPSAYGTDPYAAPPAWDAQGSGSYMPDPYAPQNAWSQPANSASAWTPAFTQTGGQAAYSQRQAFAPSGRESEYQTAPRPERGWFAPREEARPQNNISYMPGYAPDAGSSWTHVEHIMTMTSLKSCYEAIECMKNGETLIITLDAIANEGESMRCQDMLAGAAFTLGCSVRMLQGGRLVLIAPEGVKILPELSSARSEMPPAFVPPAAPVQETPPAGRRERRTGARAEEWNAARNGERDHYNPYTGTMPAAAGAYGSFGGYGY